MTDAPDRRSNLSDALRAVAEDDAARGASIDVQARLLNEVRGIARARRRRRLVISTVAAAASIVAVIGLAWQQRTCCAPTPVPAPTPTMTVARAEATTPFIPLLYSTVPMNGGHIVRMRVPERALLAYGLAIPTVFDASASRTVLADVLVGNDGLARAVRFVRPALSKEQ